MYEQYANIRLVYDLETGAYLGAYELFGNEKTRDLSNEKAAEILEELAKNAPQSIAFRMKLRARQIREVIVPSCAPSGEV